MSERYETDLTDEQWEVLGPLLPEPARTGRPSADLREVANAILYLNRTGCQWRMLPKCFPPWSTVHTWYRKWRKDGTWDRINEALRRRVRSEMGRDPDPSSSAIDSQSAPTAQGGEKGYDAGKKTGGRKRHGWVDSTGLLLAVMVTAASVSDASAARDLLLSIDWQGLTRLRVVYADAGYRAGYLAEEVGHAPFDLEVVSRPEGAKGWVLLPQRWVVERTWGWILRWRRNARHYEHLTQSSEAMVKVSMIGLMIRRLEPKPRRHSQRFRYNN